MMHDLAKSHEHHDLIRELLKEKEQLRKENVDLKIAPETQKLNW